MSQVGSVPIQILRVTNTTIAASALGTAASTIVGTVGATHVRAWEVFNLTGLHLELVVGSNASGAGTNGSLFVPHTTVSMSPSMRQPVALSKDMVISLRTVLTTPATIASTNPFYINLWA